VSKALRNGCTNRYRCIVIQLFLIFIFVILFFTSAGLGASEVALEISISIVEDDIFGPGDTFHTIIEIRNREAKGRIDVTVIYDVVDLDENIILSDSKTVAIETKSSFAEEFTLPASIKAGSYLLRANVTTLDRSSWSTASRSFRVEVVTEEEQRIVEYIMAGGLVFTGGALVLEHRRISKMKVSGRDLKKYIGEQNKK
jgi:hypothetical protein